MNVDLEGIRTLPHLLQATAQRHGGATAVATTDSVSFTYAGLEDAMTRGASLLRRRGLSPGAKAALLLHSGPRWVAAFFAVLEAGLVAVPLPVETPPDQIRSRLRQVDAGALICGPEAPDLDAGIVLVQVADLLGPSLPDASPIRSSPIRSSPEDDDTALLAFTSGTTGMPRAVELSHRNLLSNLRALLQVDRPVPGDVFLSLLPLSHLYELTVGLLAPLACGASVVYAGLPAPNRVVALLLSKGVTHTLAVPALLESLYKELLDSLAEEGLVDPDRRQQPLEETARRLATLGAEDLEGLVRAVRQRIGERLRFVGSGGAALTTAWEEILPRLGIILECGYGLTEASPLVSVGRCGDAPPGSVGRPLPGVEVRIGSGGEVCVRGPNVMKGYYKDPQTTEWQLADGWLHTGDLGYLDQDGNLFLTGRAKEAIVTASGTCLDPADFEACYQSPLFQELCVTAVPDVAGNDLPTLVVVPAAPDVSDARVHRELARLRSRAPAHLRLERIVVLSQPLPRTLTGKVRRRYLADVLHHGGMDA